jgi:hypothetical protein
MEFTKYRLPLSIFFFNNTGVGCQENKEASTQPVTNSPAVRSGPKGSVESKTENIGQKPDGCLPPAIYLLTPETRHLKPYELRLL